MPLLQLLRILYLLMSFSSQVHHLSIIWRHQLTCSLNMLRHQLIALILTEILPDRRLRRQIKLRMYLMHHRTCLGKPAIPAVIHIIDHALCRKLAPCRGNAERWRGLLKTVYCAALPILCIRRVTPVARAFRALLLVLFLKCL